MDKLRVTIGRSSQCSFVIPDADQHKTVSGEHATIYETDNVNVYTFEDHSTNGSYINGKFIHNECCEIGLKDHITLGKTYVLPFEDIVKRYFESSRTTKKKPKQESPQETPPAAPIQSPVIDQPANQPVPSITPTQSRNNIPAWVWFVLAGAVTIAFVIGCLL